MTPNQCLLLKHNKQLITSVKKRLDCSLVHQRDRIIPKHFLQGTFPKMCESGTTPRNGNSRKATAKCTKYGNQKYQSDHILAF